MSEDCENYRMPFGKHEGETLLEISESDEGLKYLDWLLGGDINMFQDTREAIEEFVSLPHIEREMNRVIG